MKKRKTFKELLRFRMFNYIFDFPDSEETFRDKDFIWIYNQFIKEYNNDRENALREWSKDQDISDFLERCSFIRYYDLTGNHGYGCPVYLCYPTDELKMFFSDIAGIKFVDINYYCSVLEDTALLKIFLKTIGVHTCVEMFERRIWKSEITERDLVASDLGRDHKWREISIIGCHEILETIFKTGSKEASVKLWELLYVFFKKGLLCDWESGGRHSYFYYKERVEYFEPLDLNWLRNRKWLLNRYGDFISPKELKLSDLAKDYKNVDGGEFFHLLGME